MTITTIGGPWTKAQADDTARTLGKNCSVYGIERKDAEGYGTGEFDYFVERDDSILPGKIFGYDEREFMARQYRKDA